MNADGATTNKLTAIIMSTLSSGGSVIHFEIAKKLLYFGANSVSSFQGLKTNMTSQIKEKFALFATGFTATHICLNLAAQSLSQLTVMRM